VVEIEPAAAELTAEEYAAADYAEALTQSDEEEFEYKGITYLRNQDNIVYSSETSEEIGRWNGKAIEFFANDE
jgi:hypothetical protein